MGAEWDLGQATEFLVVAATLLDLKAARLLPSGEVEDEEDLALLEARDLLFARLLQYRAYKQVAAVFAGRMADEARPVPAVGRPSSRSSPACCPRCCSASGPQEFAALAARALDAEAGAGWSSVDHLHAPHGQRARAGRDPGRPAAPRAQPRRSGR